MTNKTAQFTPGPIHNDQPCTCYILLRTGEPLESSHGAQPCANISRIELCPMHAAAPAMYEALLSILPATDIVSGQETDNCRWCGRDYTDHAVETGETLELCSSDDCPGYIARAALAQAEGR